MKIALIIWELNLKGGTQRLALEQARNMVTLGHSVDIYCYYHDGIQGYTNLMGDLQIYSVKPSEEKKSHIPLKNRNLWEKITYFPRIYIKLTKNIFWVEKNIHELVHLIKKSGGVTQYDAINLHDYTVYRTARLMSHKNIVWTMNDIQRPPLTGKSKIHNVLFNTLQKIVARIEIRNIKKIVVLDQRNVNLCKSYYHRNSIIVRGGLDLDMFKEISIQRTYAKPIYTVFLSSIFFPWRRFEDVVDAVEILKKGGYTQFRVHINGVTDRAYTYYLSIKDRIEKKGLGDLISITTGLGEKELVQVYAKTDIFIFPNHNQTWGLAVFEAMLAGCACVVSTSTGASEILTNEENALLVSPKNPQEIARAIESLITNPKKIEKISKNAITFVKKNLSWKQYAENIITVMK